MRANTTKTSHTETFQRQGSFQCLVPGNLMFRMHIFIGIVCIKDFKSCIFKCLNNLLGCYQGGKSISNLNSLLDTNVLFVVGIITTIGKYNPFISGKVSTLFQAFIDPTETSFAIRTMASGLNLIGNIKSIWLEVLWNFLKITLYNSARLSQSLQCIVFVTNANLIIINSYSGDISSSKSSNVPHRSSYTTSNIEYLLRGIQSSSKGQVILGAMNRLAESFTFETWSKVKRLSPAPLIKISHKIIKRVHHGFILLLSQVNALLGRCGSNVLSGTTKEFFIALDRILHTLTGKNRIVVAQEGNGSNDGV
mmetsp:Transcript_34/g.74  ORF Transcript_34/g.74 Transcript_34/m.74 type:complete len:308 (+) Transcript_34:249-1172(+)